MKLKFIILIFLFTLLAGCSPTAFCAETGAEKEELEDSIRSQINELELDEFDDFVRDLNNDSFSDGIRVYLADFIRGEDKLSIEVFAEAILGNFLSEIVSCLPICASIILICILSSIISGFSPKIAQNATNDLIQFVCFCAILVLLISSVMGMAEQIKNTISMLSSFMNVIFPILTTLLTVVGGGASVAVFSPYVAILSSVIINVVNGFIFPLFMACLALSVVGNLTQTVKLNGLRKFLKTFAEWLLGLGFGLFCTLIGGRSIMSAGIDNVTVRATKFALSSYVPILGGYLSDGFDVVLAGSLLIKNALGVTGIFIILLIVIVPLVKLIVFILALKLTSGIIESVSDKRVTEMIGSISSSMGILISVLLGVAFVFFFVLLLIVYTVNAGVL